MNSSKNSYSSATSSNMTSKKYSGGNPFSSINKSTGKGSTEFNINYQNQFIMSNDMAYFIIDESNIILTVTYSKEKNQTIINYKKISYKDKEGIEIEITIEELKRCSSEDFKMNSYFQKFIEFLEEVEKELKDKYKEEKETEIFMEIKSKDFEKFNYLCTFFINDGRKEDHTFPEEDFLNNSQHEALLLMVDALVE